MSMDYIAQVIGYSVMISAGVIVAAGLAIYASNRAWKAWNGGIASRDLNTAVREWKQRNPGKYEGEA